MTHKHIVLVWWKPDADQAAIDTFLEAAPRLLAAGPFISCEHGVGRKIPPSPLSADWGYIAEMTDEGRSLWSPQAEHVELMALSKPITGEFRTFQL